MVNSRYILVAGFAASMTVIVTAVAIYIVKYIQVVSVGVGELAFRGTALCVCFMLIHFAPAITIVIKIILIRTLMLASALAKGSTVPSSTVMMASITTVMVTSTSMISSFATAFTTSINCPVKHCSKGREFARENKC